MQDPNGNLYIADSVNNRVQEVAPSGIVSSLVSVPNGGIGITNNPRAVWLDGTGNLYVTEDGVQNQPLTQELQELTGGQLVSVAGGAYTLVTYGNNGPATLSGLNEPSAVASDSHGDVYIADAGNNEVQEIAAYTHTQFSGVGAVPETAGDIYDIAGNTFGSSGDKGDGGVATAAALDAPSGVAVDASGDVYIADSGNGLVRKVSGSTGDISTVAGTPGAFGLFSGNGGPATSADLGSPGAVAVDAAGDLFITDSANNDVYEVPAASGTQRGIAMTAGDIYIIAGSAGPQPPAAPTGLTVIGTTSSSVSLSWTAPAGTITGYGVYENGTQVATTSGTSVTVSGLTPSTTYTFAVAASNSVGVGPKSASVQATTSASTGGPGAPTGLTVTGTTSSSVSLSWTAPAGTITGYDVFENGAQVTTTAGTSVTVSGLTPSTTYTFAVAAVSSSGTGATSSSVQATTSAAGGGSGAPTGLAVIGTTSSSVSLSWTAPTGSVLGYEVFENGTQAKSATGTTVTVTGLTPSTTYTFTVAAVTLSGLGPQSASVQATTAAIGGGGGGAGAPAAPTNLTGSSSASGVVSLSWTAPAGTVTGYEVFVNGALDGAVAATSTSLSGLPAGTYTFTVAAVNSAGAGPQSSPVQVTVPGGSGAAKSRAVAPALPALTAALGNPGGNSGDGGPATSALLNSPAGLAVDSAGNLYISDSGNNQVREIAASTHTQWGQSMTGGDIYTIAGSTAATSGGSGDGGPATASFLNGPQQIALDTAGDLYIADANNQAVQEVADANGSQWSQSMTAGDIYAVAGTIATAGALGNGGPAASAQLFEPFGIGTDPTGDLYILQFGIGWAVSQLQEVAATSTPSIPRAPGQISSLSPLSTATGGITVTQPGGSQVGFQVPTAGGACAPPYVQAGQFCALPQFTGATLTDTGSGWNYSPAPGSTTYSYSRSGQLLTESDPVGDLLTANYNSPAPGSGNCPAAASTCETVTAASGRSLVLGFTSDSNGNELVTSVTDPKGRIWTYGYDSADQLTSVTDPMHDETSYTYGAGSTGNALLASDLLTITSPNAQPGGPDAGDATVNVYDSLGRVTSQTDPMGFRTSFNYCVNQVAGDCMDPATGTGFVTVTDQDSNTTVYSYDDGVLAAESQHTAGTAATTSEKDYNPLTAAGVASGGTLLDQTETDGDGNTSVYGYNAMGDAIVGTAPGSDGPATDTAAFTSQNQPDCIGVAEASSSASCTQGAGPNPVAPGGVITPPASIPPFGVSWTLFDTRGDELYSTVGAFEPGSTSASYAVTSYQLFNGNSVTLGGTSISCTATAPSASLPCATINPDGVVTQLGYDSAGDLTSSSVPDGNGTQAAVSTYVFDADGEQTSATAPDGNLVGANAGNYTTVTAYDADGRKTSVTHAGGPGASVTPRAVSYGYDADGNPTSSTNARGFAISTVYNADDHAVLATNPAGNAALTCYDGDGNIAQTVPPAGVAASNLTAASCPSSYPSGYSDRLAADATVVTFDAAGNKTQVTTPAPPGQSGYETTTFSYDGNGNLVKTVAPPVASGGPGQVTVDTYDSAGDLAAQTTGYGTSAASTTAYCYDPDGQKTASVAPDGNAGGLAACETSSPWTVNPGLNPTQAAYQTTYSYDSDGELVSTTTPATAAAPHGAVTAAAYDPAGNQLTSTAPNGVVTTFTYTPGGQTATVSYSGSAAPGVSYAYDANGSLTGMTDATGPSSEVYDPFGEVTSAQNGAGQAVSYAYDPDGDVTGITYPLPATATWATSDTVSYGYDHADLLTSVTDFTGNKITIGDTPDGLPNSVALGTAGDTVTTSYGGTDTPSNVTLANATSTLASYSFSDTPDGGIATETDTPSSATSPTAYGYDAQDRVTSLTPGTGNADSYAYDPSGNLLDLPAGATGTYDHAGELTSAATTSYSYNADGERLTASAGGTATATGTWNGARELTGYAGGAAPMSGASYNGNGLRASATFTPTGGNPVTEGYVWNGDNLMMDSDNAYIYRGGRIPAEQVSLATGAVTYLVADALGSIRAAVDNTGALEGSTSYDAWGNPQATGGLTAITPFGFAGSYTDPDGLIYLINRYYDPATGQFLSIDPDVAKTGQPYAYTNDDPVNETDPTGLATLGICGAFGGSFFQAIWTGEGCLTRTIDSNGHDDIGVTVTYAFSGSLNLGSLGKRFHGSGFSVSVSDVIQVSNATKLSEMGGFFYFVNVAAAVGDGITATVFWGGTPFVFGFEGGPSEGVGGDVNVGMSNTLVHQVNNKVAANILRVIWDAILGPFAAIAYTSQLAILLLKASAAFVEWSATHKFRL